MNDASTFQHSNHGPPPLDSFEFFKPQWANDEETPARRANLMTGAPTTAEEFVSTRRQPGTEPPEIQLASMRDGQFGTKPPEIDEDWDTSDLDWAMIKQMRVQATNELTEVRQSRDTPLTDVEEREAGREIIDELMNTWVSQQMREGNTPDEVLVQRLTRAVNDELFGMGRLQPLIDSKWIENIEVHGSDWTLIELVDGRLVYGPPIADSDEQLVRDVQFWASRASAPRPFSQANPSMNLPLGQTARLAAIYWVTQRPIITVRIHGLVEVTFEDLEAKGTLTPLMSNFLSAVVNSGASIVVSGAQGAGKTTLCRALCAALPPTERIITFETDRELHLEMMPEKHPRVFGIEARPGSGEFRGDGTEAGLYTVGEGLKDALRHNGDRLLVGEVRGAEIMPMIQAMQSGTGSISTTHARSARDTYLKLVTCALEQPGVSEAYANRAVASAINYVAFIEKVRPPGQTERVRKVTEIVAIELTGDGVAYTDVFKADADGQIRAAYTPPFVEELVEAGFDHDAFQKEAAAR